MMSGSICAIFVPQGAEFKAVARGLARHGDRTVALYATPMGPKPVQRYLEQWLEQNLTTLGESPQIVFMGLCGSLTPQLQVGNWVVYRNCLDAQYPDSVPIDAAASTFGSQLGCDAALLKTLQERLGKSVTIVTSVMCDRMVHQAAAKQALAIDYDAQVVDMEGHSVLKTLNGTGMRVGMVRVISDDATHDLPDLSPAMADGGTLNPMALAGCMVREPKKSLRLIQGSLKGLKALEQAAAQLLSGPMQ